MTAIIPALLKIIATNATESVEKELNAEMLHMH